MSSATQPAFLALDLADLRYSWSPSRDTLRAVTRMREALGIIPIPAGMETREAVGRLGQSIVDEVSLTRVVTVGGKPCRLELPVALYNPFTGAVSTREGVFRCQEPLTIESCGLQLFRGDVGLWALVEGKPVNLTEQEPGNFSSVLADIRAHSLT
jgi:hypothetical protein